MATLRGGTIVRESIVRKECAGIQLYTQPAIYDWAILHGMFLSCFFEKIITKILRGYLVRVGPY